MALTNKLKITMATSKICFHSVSYFPRKSNFMLSQYPQVISGSKESPPSKKKHFKEMKQLRRKFTIINAKREDLTSKKIIFQPFLLQGKLPSGHPYQLRPRFQKFTAHLQLKGSVYGASFLASQRDSRIRKQLVLPTTQSKWVI